VTVRAYSTNPKIFKVRTFTLQVGTTPVWSTAVALTDVAKNGSLNQQLSATSALSYSVVGGALPSGTAVSSSGLVTGPSLVAGTFAFTVRATGGAANVYADRQFTLLVATTPSWVTSGTMPNTSAQVAFSTVLSATNADATKYALAPGSGALPGGCSLATNGTLSGTPSAAGSFSFVVRAVSTTSNLVYSDRAFALVVAPRPVWSTGSTLTDGAVGSSYSVQLSASNAVSYALKAGSSLPAGLSMSAGGLVTGTPSAAATATFTVIATGNASNAVAERTFTQLVVAPPVWTTASALSSQQNVALSVQLAATGAKSSGYALLSGSLPSGVTLSSSGLLAGTPSVIATYSFTVRVTSATSNSVYADRAFTLRITQLPPLSQWVQSAFGPGSVTYTAATDTLSIYTKINHHDYGVGAKFALPAGFSTATGHLFVQFDFLPVQPWAEHPALPTSESVGLACPLLDYRSNQLWAAGINTWTPTAQLHAGVAYRLTLNVGPLNAKAKMVRISDGAVMSSVDFAPAYNIADQFAVTVAGARPIAITQLVSEVSTGTVISNFSGTTTKNLTSGTQLFIAGNPWSFYGTVPSWAQGQLGTTGINDGNISFTLSGPTTIYLLRRHDWNPVDTTGFVASTKPVIPIENWIDVILERTFQAGSYTLDNDSAMYVFVSASGGVVTRV
jgi:hypothetical protein